MVQIIDAPRIPPGKFAILKSREEADAYSEEINIALGIPKLGIYTGAGVHAPVLQGATTTWDCMWKHPTHDWWAYAVKERIAKVIKRRSFPYRDLKPCPLDESWRGATKPSCVRSLSEALLRRFLHTTPAIRKKVRGGEIISDLASLEDSLPTDPQLTWRDFEETVARIFVVREFAVLLGRGSGDGGADIIAASMSGLTPKIVLVQCKQNSAKNRVGEGVVKALFADVTRYNATCGIVATTSTFTASARQLEAEHRWKIALWHGDLVATWYRARVIEGHS